MIKGVLYISCYKTKLEFKYRGPVFDENEFVKAGSNKFGQDWI